MLLIMRENMTILQLLKSRTIQNSNTNDSETMINSFESISNEDELSAFLEKIKDDTIKRNVVSFTIHKISILTYSCIFSYISSDHRTSTTWWHDGR